MRMEPVKGKPHPSALRMQALAASLGVRIPCHWEGRLREIGRMQTAFRLKYHRGQGVEELARE
jgi:hypothetical protein